MLAPSGAPPRLEAAASRCPTGFLAFRLGGCGYLVPAGYLLRVVDGAVLRPLPAPVVGWAGTVPLREPMAAAGPVVPVLDAVALLGGEALARSVLVLRVPGGPLGLAVPAPEGLRAAPERLVPVAGTPGLLGGAVQGDRVWFVLAPAYLAALWQAAVKSTTGGKVVPRPVHWLSAAAAGGQPAATQRAAPGDLLLVLGERLLDDPSHRLALLLRSAPGGRGGELLRGRPQVARCGELVAGPPSVPCVVGYRAWDWRVVPAVDLNALGAVEAGSDSSYAVLLALDAAPAPPGIVGVALLTTRMQGIYPLRRVTAQGRADEPIAARGETAAGPVGVLSYPHLLARLLAVAG
ncbi:MAG TPA: hypothetical protein VKZ60_19560 [Chloroflexota bacterium]|nr:hypothetical protein [Chloroflexota bacterium]